MGIARFVPAVFIAENAYILMEGVDFQQVEQSRVEAGVWVVVGVAGGKIFKAVGFVAKQAFIGSKELIKGSVKLYKLAKGVKGAKIIELTESEIKLLQTAGKQITRQNWNGYANIFKANADEIAEAAAKIKNHRIAQNAGTQGNYGYLEGKIGNITKNGEMVRSGQADQNISELFEAFKVNSQQVVGGEGAWLRNTDSEYKMLNRLANDLKAVKGKSYPEITGELKIVSERQYCPSCQGVIQQFHEMFPNVKLILIDNVK
jgi:hypothetical protein